MPTRQQGTIGLAVIVKPDQRTGANCTQGQLHSPGKVVWRVSCQVAIVRWRCRNLGPSAPERGTASGVRKSPEKRVKVDALIGPKPGSPVRRENQDQRSASVSTPGVPLRARPLSTLRAALLFHRDPRIR